MIPDQAHTAHIQTFHTVVAVVLPLLAAVINNFIPNKVKITGWISTIAILLSAAFAISVFAAVWNTTTVHTQQLWFTIGATKVYAGVWLNNLSVMMLALVPVIALPVHIYSMAYMREDERFNRYFTYLSFFCFSMLALVVVDSTVLLYAFWELVGFSSYLLIGFWFTRDKAVQANKKAFIMNRIGDIGLLSAIIILFAQYGTFDLVQLFGDGGLVSRSVIENGLWVAPAGQLPAIWQYVAFWGIFLGMAAKSAQFPLHTWLPDAMEGPTSVSALIHAATMVAAGVFLLGRAYPLFTPEELSVFAVIGCFTAFMAASIALTQNDLKRILAYSTISQLGFMVLAMGVGAYASSLFHLATHAFFKCLLFLVAGIVIHEMQHVKHENHLDIDPQNILYMGGLRKKLPLTFIAAVVGSLALIGLLFTSGYLSKDGILIQAFEWAEGKAWYFQLVPAGALLTSLLTAFYVSRLIVKVFFGKFRLLDVHPGIKLHISDGGWNYKLPLVLLALCSLFPLFSLHPWLYEHAWLYQGFLPSNHLERMNIYHTLIPIGVNIFCVMVVYLAYAMYVKRNYVAHQNSRLFKLSYNQWYIDAFYNKVIVNSVLALSRLLYWFDRTVIDGLVNLLRNIVGELSSLAQWTDRYIVNGIIYLITVLVRRIGNLARLFQGGKVQYYLYSMLAVVLLVFIFKLLI
ncbi:NADH-quinone oxidoreductase subunit L [Mucilaginibacter sp. UR6-1]|uniref:NADH-quinone oxidoreductase subunit 5 family protein n=1 Tax=Mucilaginibacter sp. UR6-1 TaxID=1435643 RepID=UPI001E2C2965|nr:NADH-quinone oxidoreductase subunit L [Mucilaginibacter sp. UR6-1]MCC8408919.1 NADH-quinone oxidoreductase subunit L [Mucilaginibacter sp. UR6-1]